MLSHHPQAINGGGLSLPVLRLTLGIAALLTSLYFSISFLSQGATGAAFIAALSFCLITEITKALFAGDVMYYSALGQNDKSLFALLVVAILFALSIMAAVWFLISNPLKEDVALNHATHKTAQLEQAINAKKVAIAACNPSYVTKCVNPRTAELSTLQAEYNAALSSESQYNAAAANQAFWKQSADFIGTSPENLKMGLALVRSVLLELLGIVLIGQFSSNKRLQGLSSASSAMHGMQSTLQDNSGLLAEIEALKLQLANGSPTPAAKM